MTTSPPNNGDTNWGTELNTYLVNVIQAQVNQNTTTISAHLANSPADPHGDRAYALSLVTPFTSGANLPNGFVQLSPSGQLSASMLTGVVPGGTNTSSGATASTPALVSGTAAQLSTTQDAMLYIDVKVSSVLAVAIGPTSATAVTVFASATASVGLQTIRVPAGWYVNLTFTSANVTLTAVTC